MPLAIHRHLPLLFLLALTGIVYYPSLNGGFLFDDWFNLPKLGEFGPVDNQTTFFRYITSGPADPTGRPLSMLTFLIDAQNWPADPYPFKRTNLLLHLLNGLLLYALLARLTLLAGKSSRQRTAVALLATSFWLLHPLMVSTVSYIVQREAMLPATFCLLALLGHLVGNRLAVDGRLSGVALSALAIIGGTLLGVLSKANGVLIPLMVWIIDAILVARYQPVMHPHTRLSAARMRRMLLVLPSVLVFVYLAKQGWDNHLLGVLPSRSWTILERLMTEPRILLQYLGSLFLPQPYTAGLFNDAIVASKGVLEPASTLPSLLAVFGLLIAAFLGRYRFPIVSASVLFFFAGHVLESTVVPLELYYEHRNYWPAMLLFWPFALWLTSFVGRENPQSSSLPDGKTDDAAMAARKDDLRWLKFALIVILPIGLAAMTLLRADLWGSTAEQALIWASKNPDSPRAQTYAAQMELARGATDAATLRLRAALKKSPDQPQVALNLLDAECKSGSVSNETVDAAALSLTSAAAIGRMGFQWFSDRMKEASQGICSGFDDATLRRLIAAAEANPLESKIAGRRQDILHLRGRLALINEQPAVALELFTAALDAEVRPQLALGQAALLANAGHAGLGLTHLDHFLAIWSPPRGTGYNMQSLHKWLLARQGYWTQEVSRMQGLLRQDQAKPGAVNTPESAAQPDGLPTTQPTGDALDQASKQHQPRGGEA